MVRQDNIANWSVCQPILVLPGTGISGVFDKRALTTTDSRALNNSLLHLSYLASVSTARTANLLEQDGGLELVVRILGRLNSHANGTGKNTHGSDLPLIRISFSAALACLSSLAVRGTQSLRLRLLTAGVISALLPLLQSAAAAMQHEQTIAITAHTETDTTVTDHQSIQSPFPLQQLPTGWNDVQAAFHPNNDNAYNFNSNDNANASIHPSADTPSMSMDVDTTLSSHTALPLITMTALALSPIEQTEPVAESSMQGLTDNDPFPTLSPLADSNVTVDPLLARDERRRRSRIHPSAITTDTQSYTAPSVETLCSDDLLLAIKLIAYLSKYYNARHALHTAYSVNIYSLIEPLTNVSVPPDLRKWAIICMRSCFKRSGDANSFRRCSNLKCSKTESHLHEFSKCSRCRRVTYCSKSCQCIAWTMHRCWCMPSESHFTAESTAAQIETTAL
ncbi:hypothetical protein BDV3_002797 [Batrachochytrium dendrobatidis]|uniref:MYND-type domain-containing protein n=1 Tax=Batrachochytrium dendrobatidis (strain JEL423) TaxID=403673 RepID=A0A177WZS1_BATDL|nr:hypothetical protein O5D80_000919 [Batrachochytrium dendrobatidis]KAK5672522.1 hypothetical protein QVD99_001282 [Batrachochytrium dendrobatidis]OAJ44910.1 hypothetical protein BDEG_28092 [Batrachochytrium dendrobatidis JEL423]